MEKCSIRLLNWFVLKLFCGKVKERKEKKMHKSAYIVVALIFALLLSVFTMLPANAFIYPNCNVDDKYEFFGPHADQLIFQMYGGEDPMWTALQKGEIDLTDWPLTTVWRSTFYTNPDVKVVSAGGEAGFYTMDFNYNNHSRMGNPPGAPPNRPNPVYDAANGIPPISNNVFFRLGCGNLFNRATFNAFVGDAGVQMLTVVPVYMGGYVWPNATGYVYSRVLAEAQFALGKIKQDKSAKPYTRYWDRDNDNVVDAGEKEACVLKQTWRMDAYRKKAGEMLNLELTAMNFTFTLSGERTGGANYQQVMLDKNYHITTLGWIFIGPDPDFLYDLYHIVGYWDDPESSAPNSAALNDTVLNDESAKVKFAADSTEARAHAWLFQERFEAICAQIPLFCNQAYKASAKYYTGGNDGTIVGADPENIYRRVGGVPGGARREWLDVCNQMGLGSNSFWSMLNMYPNCTIYGTGNMTIRYGWKEQAYPAHINPFYSEWYWDAIVLGETYDSLGYRDPYDLSTWKPYLIKAWETGVWIDPGTGEERSKVRITLRPDVKFQDGTPMTVADVVFSLVEAGPLMIAKGFQPPWWWPTGELVQSMYIIDAYTVELLFSVKSFLAESWTLGGFYIVPKHIWKPIIVSGNPSQFAPDPNIIGSGPYRFKSFSPTHSVVMVANKPGSIVKTDRAGSVPITSPGVFLYCPVDVNVHTLLKFNNTAPVVNPANPIGSGWHMEKPYFSYNFVLTKWTDNGNLILDYCDKVYLVPVGTPPAGFDIAGKWYHVFAFEMVAGKYVLKVDYYGVKFNMPGPPWELPIEIGVEIRNEWMHLCSGSRLIIDKYVYVDDVLISTSLGVPLDTLSSGIMVPDLEEFNLLLATCHHKIVVRVHVTGPSEYETGKPNPWISQWIEVRLDLWITILQDIGGTTYYDAIELSSYPYKDQLKVPDCIVDIDDILTCALAYGSYPGHPRWTSTADIAEPYYFIDISEILDIALKYGQPQ